MELNLQGHSGHNHTQEQERQLTYIEKAKEYVQAEAKRVGHELTCCVTTFVCKTNDRDS